MAIGKLESVPVDVSRAKFWFVASAPAQKWDSGVWRPKSNADGVVGTDVDLLVSFGDARERDALKLTVYGPVPDFADYERVRPVGLRASVWTARDRAGGGMWFAVDRIESADSTSADSTSSRSSAGKSAAAAGAAS